VSFEDGLIIVIYKWVLEFQTKTNWLPKLLVSEGFHKKSLSGYEANGFYIQISYANPNNFLQNSFLLKTKKKKLLYLKIIN